jgi:hypothetical protein
MTVCPHCQSTLPSEYAGATCPACNARLPALTGRRNALLTPLTGVAIDKAAAAARARPSDRPPSMRPPMPRPEAGEDRWDLPESSAPPSTPPATAPSSVGRPGGPPSGMGLPGGTGEVRSTAMFAAVKAPAGAAVAPAPSRDASSTLSLGRIGPAESARVLEPHAPAPSSAGVPAPAMRSPAATLVGAAPVVPAAPVTAGVPGGAPGRPPTATLVGTAPATAVPPSVRSTAAPVAPADARTQTLVGASPVIPSPSAPPAPPPARLVPVDDTPARGLVAEPAPPARPAEEARRTPSSRPPAPPEKPEARGTPSPTTTQRQRLVLASEVLREDLVPHEPAARAMRITLAAAGATLAGSSLAGGLRDPQHLAAWAVPGVTALVVALAPLSYASRALLAFAPALPALAMQAVAAPRASLSAALLYTAVSALLPAALLFRAHFRASRRARAFVAAALGLALAWVLHPHGGALLEPGPAGVPWALGHVSGLGLVTVMLSSLLAFMGMNTTGACHAWAVLAVGWSGLVVLGPSLASGAPIGLATALAAANAVALAAILGTTLAGLLAVYARPSEPSTGIGVAATSSRRGA